MTVTGPTVLGAVKAPEEEMLPADACQVTAALKLPVPWTLAQHWTDCPSFREWAHDTVTEVMVGGGGAVTLTVAGPDLDVSATDVAVIVTCPEVLGAVNSPEVEMLPAEAVQVTDVLKLPVPCTLAEHWSVCPSGTEEAAHDTVTEVIVGGGLPPLPQPAATNAAAMKIEQYARARRRVMASHPCG